ncbi:MAG: hypothetical protein HY744_03820 [Deltaproteobacteria bacterium]|nr:hypothetical protein [Deltaproteobacteria bacterium]
MGFADSSARKQAAVERTAPFVAFSYTVLVLWFAQRAHSTILAAVPLRPWYRHKLDFSFADVLRTAQRVLAPLDVLDPPSSLANLQESSASHAHPTPVATSIEQHRTWRSSRCAEKGRLRHTDRVRARSPRHVSPPLRRAA